MFFTLGVSAASPERCAELTGRALAADPSVMPVPGPAEVAWRSPDGRAAILHWGNTAGAPAGASQAGTISGSAADGTGAVCARTSVTRVDPVYLAQVPGAALVADRATWAAWTASRLGDLDPLPSHVLSGPYGDFTAGRISRDDFMNNPALGAQYVGAGPFRLDRWDPGVEMDGTVVFLGRGSLCINTAGEKVYPEEVEDALRAHPAVLDANVFGIPDEIWNEVVTAVVALQPGRKATEDELRAAVRDRVAGYKVPKRLVFVTDIPRSPTGKAQYDWARQVVGEALRSGR